MFRNLSTDKSQGRSGRSSWFLAPISALFTRKALTLLSDLLPHKSRIFCLVRRACFRKLIYLIGVANYNNEHLVIKMDPKVPNNWTKVAVLPKSGRFTPLGTRCLQLSGNGLALHFKTGILYATTESNFIPGLAISAPYFLRLLALGKVYRVDPRTGSVSDFAIGLWSADGAWIDQDKGLLFVSEVIVGMTYL